MRNPRGVETDGIALGETAEVMPVDSGLDPVRGALVHCSADEIVVRRTDPRAGTVHGSLPALRLPDEKMPQLTTDDGVKLHYEEAGAGMPIVFVHEFAGDHRSWEPQLRHFSRRYRCIAYNARGYPPSDVPQDVERYSQARARDDIRCVLDALGIQRAHIVGLSMGAFASLHFGITYRLSRAVDHGRGRRLRRASRAVQAVPGGLAARTPSSSSAKAWRSSPRPTGMARRACSSRTRTRAASPSTSASSPSIRRSARRTRCSAYQARRPSLYDLTAEMARIDVPTLIMAGDEEEPCLEVCLLMKRAIPTAGLAVLPKSGHGINLEEPALFNQLLEDFLHQVEAGRWAARDARSTVPSIYGREASHER